MDAKQQFDAGNLTAAIDLATQQVKAHPADAVSRTFLFELLCFAGDLDRAEKQLAVISQQDAQSEWGTQVYGNILHAERARRRLFAEGRKPEFLLDPPELVMWHLEILDWLRQGQAGAAVKLLERSQEARTPLAGKWGDKPFDDLCDCDDVLAPVLELIVLRDYVWLPYEQIRQIEVAPPERPRDLIWAPVQLELIDGSQRRGYVPALYPDSYQHADEIRLGRLTDWIAEDGVTRGIGLRTLLCGDDACGWFELKSLTVQPAE